MIVGLVWIPLRRSTLGLSLYAIGSNQLAAFRSGVPGRTDEGRQLRAHRVLRGARRADADREHRHRLAGPGSYTLQSVAAIVLGGVSLAGGRGGIVGPILAVVILALIRTDLTFLGVNPNLSTAVQGAILIGVVMFGSFLAMRKVRA